MSNKITCLECGEKADLQNFIFDGFHNKCRRCKICGETGNENLGLAYHGYHAKCRICDICGENGKYMTVDPYTDCHQKCLLCNVCGLNSAVKDGVDPITHCHSQCFIDSFKENELNSSS